MIKKDSLCGFSGLLVDGCLPMVWLCRKHYLLNLWYEFLEGGAIVFVAAMALICLMMPIISYFVDTPLSGNSFLVNLAIGSALAVTVVGGYVYSGGSRLVSHLDRKRLSQIDPPVTR